MATSNEPGVLMFGRAHAVMNVFVETLERTPHSHPQNIDHTLSAVLPPHPVGGPSDS